MRPVPLASVMLLVALLTVACSGDDGGAADDTTPGSSAGTVSVTSTMPVTATAPPTVTVPSPSVDDECPDVDPVAMADVDGDGVREDVILAERDGGQALWVCGSERARSLELEYAIWYVAVVDVEPDGVDEIFLGAAGFDDAPGTPAAKLHWIHDDEGGLAPRIEDFAGVWIGPNAGAGCLDVDGDGARELLELWIDTETSTDATVVWNRNVSDALAPVGDPYAAEGEFVVGRDDDAIALLSTFSCGDDLVELHRVPLPAAICRTKAGPAPLGLDGDGTDDLVRQWQSNAAEVLAGREYGGPAVVVCLGSGATDMVRVGGMGEIFGVGEGPGDQPVVWTGGTTVSAAYSSPMVVEDGRLRFLRTAEGDTLTLRDGYEGVEPPDGDVGASGCDDVDGDGEEEFVQVVVTVSDDQLVWTRTGWNLVDAGVVEGVSDSGTMPLPDAFEFGDLYGIAAELAPDNC